ncbi:hypothetical protein L198_06645 [Cryptococcus wingfieldii CBS 7118]|uniref:Uncharacterized protein n=1 Tax=Cryptococcus wingfieldii CBS 7118 TaxID=1295528 RepID=A0A1E3IJS6_9TREE|nr:hypothetical protein L198_06645 [Cryptococcus wingfieldii CBS 7118]ODN88843.1 hypothetical protein L198_06645 [Cryptococcus wingfieldii CBS 7118]
MNEDHSTPNQPKQSIVHPIQLLPTATNQNPPASQGPNTMDRDTSLPQAPPHATTVLEEGLFQNERLEKWANIKVGQLLKVEHPEPLSLNGNRTPYYSLMNRVHEGSYDPNVKAILFDGRPAPEVSVRKDLPKHLADLEEQTFPPWVSVECSSGGGWSEGWLPYTRPSQYTRSFAANLLHLAAQELKYRKDIGKTVDLINGKKSDEPATVSFEQSTNATGGISTPLPPRSRSSSEVSSMFKAPEEHCVFYTFALRTHLHYKDSIERHTVYERALLVADFKRLQVDPELEVTDSEYEAKVRYEKGLSHIIKQLHRAWERFGTVGLFALGPFFLGNIAVECKPPAGVGPECFDWDVNNHHSPAAFFEKFDRHTLPHTFLLPYSTNHELAKQLGVRAPLPLLNLEGLQMFEHVIMRTYASVPEMSIEEALGKRADSSHPSTAQPQPGDRSPIQWYLSARWDVSPMVEEQDVKDLLEAFNAHVSGGGAGQHEGEIPETGLRGGLESEETQKIAGGARRESVEQWLCSHSLCTRSIPFPTFRKSDTIACCLNYYRGF